MSESKQPRVTIAALECVDASRHLWSASVEAGKTFPQSRQHEYEQAKVAVGDARDRLTIALAAYDREAEPKVIAALIEAQPADRKPLKLGEDTYQTAHEMGAEIARELLREGNWNPHTEQVLDALKTLPNQIRIEARNARQPPPKAGSAVEGKMGSDPELAAYIARHEAIADIVLNSDAWKAQLREYIDQQQKEDAQWENTYGRERPTQVTLPLPVNWARIGVG